LLLLIQTFLVLSAKEERRRRRHLLRPLIPPCQLNSIPRSLRPPSPLAARLRALLGVLPLAARATAHLLQPSPRSRSASLPAGHPWCSGSVLPRCCAHRGAGRTPGLAVPPRQPARRCPDAV